MKNSLFNCILILALLVSLVNCAGNSGGLREGLTEEELNQSDLLSEKFSSAEQLVYGSDTLIADQEVLSYYKSNEFVPVWTDENDLNKKGEEFLTLLDNSYDYGFLPSMFNTDLIHDIADSSLADAELLLTNAFFLFATHIHVGCIDSSNYTYVWKKDSIDYNLEDEINKVREGESAKVVIESHQPQFWDYLQLQKGLASFLDSFELDTNHYSIPAFKDDSIACYKAANEALAGHHFLDSSLVDDDTVFIERLKYFQAYSGLKPDAIVGKWTGKSLEKSNLDRFYQAALSLEKWRWKKDYPSRYIRVNIPEYTLYFVDSGDVKRKHRVVVGAYATQTPEFHATMLRMVTNPFWNVPYSISSTEILAGARKDTNYFDKRGYKVFKGNEQVDPSSVDWSAIKQNNFQYRVRQDGGSGNSLGKIKFLFPNVNSVFIHDTPSKSLFNNDMRAYSHGCVRLHEPYELAKSILATEKHPVDGDTLVSYINRGMQKVVELNEPFEVYIEYFTAVGDSAGKIAFFPDVYGRDEKYLKNTFKKFKP